MFIIIITNAEFFSRYEESAPGHAFIARFLGLSAGTPFSVCSVKATNIYENSELIKTRMAPLSIPDTNQCVKSRPG